MTELIEIYESLKVGLPNIQEKKYQDFSTLFELSQTPKQKYGELFYKYFCLHLVSDQTLVSQIYPLGEEKAKKLISEIFKLKVS